jgi:hypothetical protein
LSQKKAQFTTMLSINGNGHAKTESKQNYATSAVSDSINMRIKKEKKKLLATWDLPKK